MAKYFSPKTSADIERMRDDRVCEGPWLEYKSAKLFDQKNEKVFDTLSKEATAFANADGGVILIGLEENSDDRSIREISPVFDQRKSESWIEDGLLTRISPPMKYFINRIEYDGGFLLAIDIPATLYGPHQAADRKYYARRQFRVDPLLDFEVRDIQNRIASVDEVVEVRMLSNGQMLRYEIHNGLKQPIFNVRFGIKFIQNFEIATSWQPMLGRPYSEPFKMLHSRETRTFVGATYDFLRYRLQDEIELFSEYDMVTGETKRVSSRYFLRDLDSVVQTLSPEVKVLQEGVESLRSISRHLEKIGQDVSKMRDSAFHPSGLNFSATVLRSMMSKGEVKWPGWVLSYEALSEILEIELGAAIEIQRFLFGEFHLISGRNRDLDELNVSDELKQRIRERLILPTISP